MARVAVPDEPSAAEDAHAPATDSPESEVWWAPLMRDHARQLGFQVPTLSRPLKCLSACTGSFAEGAVMKARGDILREKAC